MKELKLSNTERRALVDDEDLERCRRYIWHKAKTDYSISILTNYDDGTSISLARFILGDFEADVIDHKDRNPFNNLKSNLRPATFQQNLRNQGIRKDNKTGFKGVHLRKNRKGEIAGYIAQININGKSKHLGIFDTPEQAARRYDKAAKHIFGEFAFLNFPDEEVKKEDIQ